MSPDWTRRAAGLPSLWSPTCARGIAADFDHASRSVKAQFKYAGKVGARYVVVIGSNELNEGRYTVKNMADSASESVAAEECAAYLAARLA